MNQDIDKACTILLNMLPGGIASRASLTSLDGNETHNSSVIKSLIDNGYVETRIMSVKAKPRPYSITYLVITSKGLRYLVNSCGDKMPFLNALELPDGKLNIRGGVSNEMMLRELYIKNAEIMLRVCGCSTELSHLSASSQPHEGTLRDIVRDAVIQTENNSEGGAEQKLPRFVSSKEMLSIMNLPKEGSSQYMFSSHTGLVVSAKDAYLTYHTGHYGMSWHGGSISRFAMVAKNVALKIAGRNPAYSFGVKNGLLFVKNAHEFELAYNDTNQKRKQKGPREKQVLGYPFEHFYIIPTSKGGMELLRLLIHEGPQFEDNLVSSLSNSLWMNEEKSRVIYRYRDNESALFSGLSMDICEIPKLLRLKDSFDEPYKILCFPWQVDYYRRIIPDAKFHILD